MYRKSQSLIEELHEKSFIKLVDITRLLFVKSETQGQCPKKKQTTMVINDHGWVEAQDVLSKVANLEKELIRNKMSSKLKKWRNG